MRPRLRSGSGRASRTRAALVSTCLFALAALAGCSMFSDPAAPGQTDAFGPARLALSVQLPALQKAGEVALRTSATYERIDRSQVPLTSRTIPLSDARAQDLSSHLDLGVCLADPQRRRGSAGGSAGDGVCTVWLTFALLLDGRVLDEQVIGPVELRPDQIFRPTGPITLYEVTSVRVDAPTGTVPLADGSLRLEVGTTTTLSAAALDRSGGVLAGSRPARWASAAPTVATVGETTGAVVAVAPGSARLTVTVGGREGVVAITVVPRSQAVTIVTSGTGNGTVFSVPAGIDCRVTAGRGAGSCTFVFPGDAKVSLSASAQEGSAFGGWGDACAAAGVTPTCVVATDQARSVRVTFAALRRLTVGSLGNGRGSVRSTPEGIACALGTGATCSAPYLEGSTVTLVATPDSGDSFVEWTGDCAATIGPTCVFTVTPTSVGTNARFERPRALTVGFGGTGVGRVTATSEGVVLPCVPGTGTATGACSASVPFNAVVTLVATPDANSAFVGWTGACSGTGECIVTGDEARSVTAVFVRRQSAVSTVVGGSGGGTVTAGTQTCALRSGQGSSTCVFRVERGRSVTFGVVPDGDSEFSGWSGACVASARATTCTLTPDDSLVSVGAVFVLLPARLTIVSNTPAGASGRVSGGDDVIACSVQGASTSGACSAVVPVGTTVTLSAAPGTESIFGLWSGPCAATGSQCSVVVRGPTSVGVRFQRPQVPLTVGISGAGGGSVTIDGAVACTLAAGDGAISCLRLVEAGATVTLRLQPASGSVAQAWGGPCATVAVTAPCTFAGVPLSVPVVFVPGGGSTPVVPPVVVPPVVVPPVVPPVVTPTLGVRSLPGYRGGGRVRSADGTIDCTFAPGGSGARTGTCDAPYAAGASVTLTLVSHTTEDFRGAWSGACTSTASSCALVVPSAGGVANISIPELVQVHVTGSGDGVTTLQFASPGGTHGCASTVRTDAACDFEDGAEGTDVTIVAAPGAADGFRRWTGDCASAGTVPLCTLRLPVGQATASVRADYDYAVSVTVGGTGTGTVAVQGITGPTTSCTLVGGTCRLRAPTPIVTLAATPAAGATFTGWSLTSCGSSPTCTFDLRVVSGVGATFTTGGTAPGSVSLVVARDPASTGAGRVVTALGACDLTPSGASGACSELVPVGGARTYTAQPTTGSAFVAWGGPCAGQTGTTCTLAPVTAGGTITARFDLLPPVPPVTTQLLTVTGVSGADPGAGTVASTAPSAGVSCAVNGASTTGTCSAGFALGAVVTLVATPSPSSTFAGWSGACTGTTPSCAVTMSQAQTVGARFVQQAVSLTLRFDPTSRGPGRLDVSAYELNCQVDGSPSGTPSGTACAPAPVKNFATITVTAVSFPPGSGFVGWIGAPCAGVQSTTCTFVIQGATTVVGRFGTPVPATLEVENTSTSGSGQVSVQTIRGVATYTRPTPGTAQAALAVYTGDVVRFTATAAGGAQFDRWTGECAAFGTNPVCTVANDFPSQLVHARFVEQFSLRAAPSARRTPRP